MLEYYCCVSLHFLRNIILKFTVIITDYLANISVCITHRWLQKSDFANTVIIIIISVIPCYKSVRWKCTFIHLFINSFIFYLMLLRSDTLSWDYTICQHHPLWGDVGTRPVLSSWLLLNVHCGRILSSFVFYLLISVLLLLFILFFYMCACVRALDLTSTPLTS